MMLFLLLFSHVIYSSFAFSRLLPSLLSHPLLFFLLLISLTPIYLITSFSSPFLSFRSSPFLTFSFFPAHLYSISPFWFLFIFLLPLLFPSSSSRFLLLFFFSFLVISSPSAFSHSTSSFLHFLFSHFRIYRRCFQNA